ncbi:MAG: diguanylate cyclase domain-containing protein [Solirubrobacterales bacterium]
MTDGFQRDEEVETERLADLRDLGILDTPPEDEFNDLVATASRIAGTPIALMSLVDKDRQWFKARRGLEVSETPRDIAFCSRAIEDPLEPLIVKDARVDPRFADNPLVTDDPNVAFYAGVPIVTADGNALGTICVIDREPGDLSEDQVEALKGISRQAAALLELRRQTRKLSSVLDKERAAAGTSPLHDPLTGLPNREALEAEIDSLDPAEPVSLFLVDVLRFSEVNAVLGREGGDQVLRFVAHLLADHLSTKDTLARVDATSFAVLVPGVGAVGAETLARDLSRVLSEPIEMEGFDPVGITVALGTATSGADSPIPTIRLLESAEQATGQAKREGAGAVVAAGSETFDARAHQADLRAALGAAIAEKAIEVAYMPVVELESRAIVGAETLARFPGEEFEGVSVEEIIALAEADGTVGAIDQLVIEQALADFSAGLVGAPSVGANISPITVGPALPERIRDALDRNGVSPDCFVVEITERVALSEYPDLKAALEQLSAMGMRIGIDDFGAGATSITDLRNLPFDAIKLDRSLTEDIEGPDSRRALMIIQALTSMAKGLGIDILAEGIETEGQREKLLEVGVTYGQGYLFGRPAPANTIPSSTEAAMLGAPRPVGAQMQRLTGSFFDQSPDLAAVGTNETLLRINGNWEKSLGWEEDALLGRPLSDLIHPEDLPRVLEQMAKAANAEGEGSFEARFQASDGSWRTLDWNLRRDPDSGLNLLTARDITREQTVESERTRLRQVMEVLSKLQMSYIDQGVSRDWWYDALEGIVELTDSEYGFLGRVEHDSEGQPFLVTYALTNIAWNDWSREVWDEYQEVGLEFHNLKTLFGVTLATGDLYIANDAPNDPKKGGLPEGHPALNHFAGIPIRGDEGIVGMAGLANRPGGYDEALIEDLDPIFASLSQIISHDIVLRRARQVEFDASSNAAAVEAILESQDIQHAIDIVGKSLEAVEPDSQSDLFVIGESRDRLKQYGITDPEDGDTLHRDACLGLTRGEIHVSQPGDQPNKRCAHAPSDSVTICTPIENPDEEFGVLITRGVGGDVGEDRLPGEAVERLTQKLETLGTALAEVARREDLTHRALTDSLTGLANRPAFIQAVNRALDTSSADGSGFGVMMFDLDEFKRVNDDLGHPAGDAALREVGVRLKKALRDDDTVARLGGDEFGILIQRLGEDPKQLERTCDRVREVIAGIPLDGIGVTASIGAVQVTGAKTSWDEIYRSADRELYESKRSGGDQAHLLLADDFIDRLDSPDA